MSSDVEIYPGGGGRIIHRVKRVAKCDFCENDHSLLCDYLINPQKSMDITTCDKKLCKVCATRIGNADFCPIHRP